MTIGSQFQLLHGPAIIAAAGRHHGLGNRLRAVIGSYALSKFEGRRFGYSWPTGKHFGARLDDLWNFTPPTVPASLSRLIAHTYPYRNHTLDWKTPGIKQERVWQIKTAHALHLPEKCPTWESELRKLTPTPSVVEYVGAAAIGPRSERSPYVGVMIRTNPISHELTLKHSPLNWYLSRMREIREFWPDVPFYIAADTPEAFHIASTSIGGCFGRADKGRYNSRAAIISSVGDLYMLAGSVHVLGPYYSSFPELAQLMAGPGLRLETSMTSVDLKLQGASTLTMPPSPLRPFDRSPLS